MKSTTAPSLEQYLDRVIMTTRHIETMRLKTAQDRDQALQESQHLLAAVARLRHQLKNLAMPE